MRKAFSAVLIAVTAAAGGALITAWTTPLAGQTPAAYRAPRSADGKPDLNGIWQALNEANYDVEMHMARPALQTRPFWHCGMVVQQSWPLAPHVGAAMHTPPVQVLPSVQVLLAQHILPAVPHIGGVTHMPLVHTVPAAVQELLVQQAWLTAPQLLEPPPPQPASESASTPRMPRNRFM